MIQIYVKASGEAHIQTFSNLFMLFRSSIRSETVLVNCISLCSATQGPVLFLPVTWTQWVWVCTLILAKWDCIHILSGRIFVSGEFAVFRCRWSHKHLVNRGRWEKETPAVFDSNRLSWGLVSEGYSYEYELEQHTLNGSPSRVLCHRVRLLIIQFGYI